MNGWARPKTRFWMAMARPKLDRLMSSAAPICGRNRPKDWRTPIASVTMVAPTRITVQGERIVVRLNVAIACSNRAASPRDRTGVQGFHCRIASPRESATFTGGPGRPAGDTRMTDIWADLEALPRQSLTQLFDADGDR